MTRSLEEEIKIKAQQARGTAKYMASIEDLVEERIRKAREKGAFDNLEGHGKPLNLYENPFEPPEMRMAYKILKDAGYCPYWMELGKDVDAAMEQFWLEVDRFERYSRITLAQKKSSWGQKNIEQRTKKFLTEARSRLENINKKVDNFNSHCPMWWLRRGRLNVNQEMAKVVDRLRQIREEVKGLP